MSRAQTPRSETEPLFCSAGCATPVDRPRVCPSCLARRRAKRALETAEERRAYTRDRAARRRDRETAFMLLPAAERERLLAELDAKRGWTR